MTDHNSVKEAETAAAGKINELTEGMIRTLLQHRAQLAREHQEKSSANKPTQLKAPSQENTSLFKSYYQKYQENGVEPRTARDAAADAAIGLGSKDSLAIAEAEKQVIANSQGLITIYKEEAAIVTDPQTSETEQQRASDRMAEIENALGIRGLPIKVKAQTINGLTYQDQALENRPDIHPELTQPKEFGSQPQTPDKSLALSGEQETLRQTYQEKLEQAGAKTPTAALASRDIVTEEGAAESPYIALAHQEIEHHQLLKRMYQSVFEEHKVSPEVASQAADQLAWGNGANRSIEVQQAHTQALANIESSQEPPADQQPSSATKAGTLPSKTSHQQALPSASVGASRESLSSQQIWDKFSPGENGVFESMAKGNEKMQRLSDQLIAKEALLAGHSPKAIQAAIAKNSPLAQQVNYPEAYARARVGAAEKSTEVEAKREQEKTQSHGTAPKELASRKNAQQKKKVIQKNQPTQKGQPKKRARTQGQEVGL